MPSTEITRFFEQWDRIHNQSVRVMEVAPDDKFSWKPADSAMTLGELVCHLPESELFLVGLITNNKVEPEEFGNLKSAAAVVEAFNRIHEACKKAISELPEEELDITIPFGSNSLTKRVLMHGMCEHEIHHRGQLYTYVRIVGVIPPPLFGDV